MRKTLQFLLAVIVGALRGRPVEIPHVRSDAPRAMLMPDGRYMPAITGADPEEDEDDPADEDPEADPASPAEDPENDPEEPEDDEEPEPEFEGDFDAERAKRAIAAERAKRKAEKKKLQKRAREAEARARELEQAQESDQERTTRERDEARVEAERERATAEKLRVDIAIREAAGEAGVPNKLMRRVLRLIDRDDIEIDGEDVEGAEDAVAALLDEIPELKGAPAKDDSEEDEESTEEPGGRPDRKRKAKKLTAKQARKLAKEDPKRWNELFDEGKIPADALGGA